MSTGTDIYYNGVTLSNVTTRRFEETVEYDETGTEVAYHKFIIRVTGYCFTLAAGVVPTLGVSTNTAAATPVASQTALRAALMEARREFIMSVNNVPILSVKPNAGTIDPPWGDVNNGPKPRSCHITLIAGAKLIRVEWEIELAVLECATNTNTSGILYNRWSMEDVFDDDFYTTRTLRGKMKTLPGLHPQDFRKFVIPALQMGFQRRSITLATSPDGLILEYQVVDVEMYAAPPFPATKWEATHTISTVDGVGVVVDLTIRLEGSKDTAKRDLLQAAAMVCYARTDFADRSRVVQGISIVDHLHANIVEMKMVVQHTPAKSLALYSKDLNFCEILKPEESQDYKREEWPIPKLYGTATPTGLLACYLQTPCASEHAVPDYGPEQDKKKPKRGTKVETYESPATDTPSIGEGTYNPAGLVNIYTHYQIDSDYRTEENKIAMPIAASNSDDGDTTAIITLARACTMRSIRVEAERFGAWPDMPSAAKIVDLGDGVTATLLRTILNPKAPQLSPDGTEYLYSNDAEYVYALNKPITSLSKIRTGRMPWVTDGLAATALTPSSLVTGLA